MNKDTSSRINLIKHIFVILLLFTLFNSLLQFTVGQPAGSTITFNTTETKPAAAADYLNTSGGTFTTLVLGGETQNIKWKAYAGNVTGVLTLDDSGNYSIYQWQETTYTGEVYASRNSSISWASVACASATQVEAEDTIMGHTSSDLDSINSTFSSTVHQGFFVGTTQITASTCKSTVTYANDTAQTPSVDAPFQELLLTDSSMLIYTTFIDDSSQGFNFNNYDFQMILAEQGSGSAPNTRYYFFLELQ